MSEMTFQSGPAVNGLRAVVLENKSLRVVVLPEAGAKVLQIRYKPLAADLLWNNPSLPPSRQPLHASYDDTWSGGWDELFPNDEGGSYSDSGCRIMANSGPGSGKQSASMRAARPACIYASPRR
jgi:hypothetical protein